MKGLVVIHAGQWAVRYIRPAFLQAPAATVWYPIVGRESLRAYSADEALQPGKEVLYLENHRWQNVAAGWIVITGRAIGQKELA